MDMWLELHSKTNPKMAQMNEVVLNMEANTLGGVEAIYVPNIESSWVGNIFNKEFLEQMDPEKYPLPLTPLCWSFLEYDQCLVESSSRILATSSSGAWWIPLPVLKSKS